MKRLLALACLAGCATAPVVKPVVPAPTAQEPVITVSAACPTSLPAFVASDAAVGRLVDKVCLVGASEDAYLRLHEAVAPREGQVVDADQVRADIELLFTQGELQDVVVVAQPLDDKRVVLSYFVSEYPKLTAVKMSGIAALKADDVNDLVHAGLRASPQLVKATEGKLLQAYALAGFPSARVSASLSGTVLEITATEGARATISTVKFEGVKKLSEALLRKPLQLGVGKIFNEATAQNDLVSLTSAYFDVGFVEVSVESATKTLASGAVELTWKVKEGAPFKVGKLSFKGLTFTDEKTLLKSFESKPKATFSRAMMKRDIGRIEELAKRAGSAVEVTPVSSIDRDKHTIDLNFELERVTTGAVKF